MSRDIKMHRPIPLLMNVQSLIYDDTPLPTLKVCDVCADIGREGNDSQVHFLLCVKVERRFSCSMDLDLSSLGIPVRCNIASWRQAHARCVCRSAMAARCGSAGKVLRNIISTSASAIGATAQKPKYLNTLTSFSSLSQNSIGRKYQKGNF